MKAKILKESLQKRFFFAVTMKSVQQFLKEKLHSDIIKEEKKYFIIDIDDNFLSQQTFKDITWYKSKDNMFGVFDDTNIKLKSTKEKGWRVLFQRR